MLSEIFYRYLQYDSIYDKIILYKEWRRIAIKHFHIVLVEPEIPQNTGNISRTCACTGASLHLVKPMMFSIDEKHVRRAGLDYWDKLDLHIHENLDSFLQYAKGYPMRFASTKGQKNHTQVTYPDNCFILFGKESAGLPEFLLHNRYEDCMRIPMRQELRSLNLSNAAAIVLYEALRQDMFAGLEQTGYLRNYS